MKIIKVLFSILMTAEFIASAHIATKRIESKEDIGAFIYACFKFFIFAWIVANRGLF